MIEEPTKETTNIFTQVEATDQRPTAVMPEEERSTLLSAQKNQGKRRPLEPPNQTHKGAPWQPPWPHL